MNGSATAPGPGWDAATAGAKATPAVARFPAWLPSPGRRDHGTPEQHLRQVISALAGPGKVSAAAGRDDEPLGRALVFRPWPARSLHIVGDSPLATEFRRLLTAGTVQGWELHPVPAGRTPLRSARRETGLPAAASLRATARA